MSLLISQPGINLSPLTTKNREASGDSLYPFDLWSWKRGRAFLGHANSSWHERLPLLPLLCGRGMNEKVMLSQVSGSDGAV